MTLPNLTNPKEGSPSRNETDVVPQSVAVPARLGVLNWFGSTSTINSGTGSLGAVDEPKTQVEKVTVERSEPEPSVPDKEERLLKMEKEIESREKELDEKKLGMDRREREVESREKELEDRKLGIDQREKELEEGKLAMDQREREVEDRCRGLDDRERVAKEGHEEMQRRIEEVERRERELEERRKEFEEEREKWVEESNRNMTEPEWKTAMEALKKEMNLEISIERRKAEERELELETRVMKKVAEILAPADRDDQSARLSVRRKKWDEAIKSLTR